MRGDYLAAFHCCDYASLANGRSGQRPVGQVALDEARPMEQARALSRNNAIRSFAPTTASRVSFWDREQMKVRNGSDVCPFQRYASYSS
ncbi:hypothetical protein, partial [Mesorhizobium sp. M7A.F.Ca.CA.001.09.1.1]|uniref:hypothetical protein n=1 Tax=Mesorhizobium sp. M7A.F.Ca.CA.001.09.1.1 TaxID=2496718 RepID=UPI0019D088D7